MLLSFWKRFLRKSKRHTTVNIWELKSNGSWCTYVAGTAFRHTVRDTGRCNLHQDLDISLHCYRAGWHNHSHLEKTRIYLIFLYSSNHLQEYKRGWLLDVWCTPAAQKHLRGNRQGSRQVQGHKSLCVECFLNSTRWQKCSWRQRWRDGTLSLKVAAG